MKTSILSLLIALAMMPLSAFAIEYDNDISVDGNVYGLIYSNNTAVLTQWGDAGADDPAGVTVPAEIYVKALNEKFRVIGVGENAFSKKNVVKITVPDDLEFLEPYAFSGCPKLTTVNIPEAVTSIPNGLFSNSPCLSTFTTKRTSFTEVGNKAFSGCAITSWTYPVTRIGDWAFYNCTRLAEVKLFDGLTYIGDYGFSGTALKEVILPKSATDIQNEAFSKMPNLTTFAFGESCPIFSTKGMGFVFNGSTKLENLYLGDKCTLAPGNVGIPCKGFINLKSFTVSDNHSTYSSDEGVLYSKDGTTLIRVPSGMPVESYYYVPSRVTTLADHCFYEQQNVKAVFLPENLREIGTEVFKESKIQSLIAPGATPASLANSWSLEGLNTRCHLYVNENSYSLYFSKWNSNGKMFYAMSRIGSKCGCDNNKDFLVNVSDITSLIKALIYNESNYDYGFDDYDDINQDGKFNVSDVTYLINFILNK